MTMEALLAQFSFLSHQAMQDENFDPAMIEELMDLFEQEVYHSWISMDAEARKAVDETELSLKEAEEYLNSRLESSMEDFWDLEKDGEQGGLVRDANAVKKMAGSSDSDKYIETALSSATATMKSARKGLSMTPKKVHPS